MNKDRIMQRLGERNYVIKLREEIRDRLCFTMRGEYLGISPAKYEKVAGTNLSHPVFHAAVDMLTASLLYGVAGNIVDEVIDVIKEIEEKGEK